MRARWVFNYPQPELPGVGMAIVAFWWPGKYYLVSTVQLDSSSLLAKLTLSLKQEVPFGKAVPGPDKYITQIFRCTKDGIVAPSSNPFYEQEYLDLSEAQIGHKLAVNLLEQGQLKLKKIV